MSERVRASIVSPPGLMEVQPIVVPGQLGGAPGDHGPRLARHDGTHGRLEAADGDAIEVLLLPLPGSSPGSPAARLEVLVEGWRFEVEVEDAERAELRERASRGQSEESAARPVEVRAIIPGRIASIVVAAGQAVGEGEALLVIEAMKMQNELRSPRAGTVARIAAAAGRAVEAGELLVVIE